MEIIIRKLSDLIQPEKNIRIHSETQLLEYEKSVRMFGQLRPIVIDENNKILAGNGLFETLFRMGKNEATCYQYTDLTENQKKKLMIADNKIFSLGIDNMETLDQFLVDLQDDLEIPGFDEDLLKQMVADADEITEMISEYGSLNDNEIQAVKERSERVEQQEQRVQSQESVSNITTDHEAKETIDENNFNPKQDRLPESEQTMDYSICPTCGGKLCL